MGDIFKTARAGATAHENDDCSDARTKVRFTIDITVGKRTLTLFTHECSAIGWARIMEMRAAGELYEQYVEAGDESGYFAPTLEMREQIKALFGNWWNRRRR